MPAEEAAVVVPRFDPIQVAESGAIFLSGWIDDRHSPLARITLQAEGWSLAIEEARIGRRRAADAAAGSAAEARPGLWLLVPGEPAPPPGEAWTVEAVLADGAVARATVAVSRLRNFDFKVHVTRYLATIRPGDVVPPRDGPPAETLLRAPASAVRREVPRNTIENISVAENGGVFIAGWINDTAEALAEIRIDAGAWHVVLPGDGLARICRDDVQAALGMPRRHPFGFWGIVTNTAIEAGPPTCACEVVMRSGAVQRHEMPIRYLFDQIELRNLALTYLATAKYPGNPHLDSVACLDPFLGRQIVDLNLLVSGAIAGRPHVERLGGRRRRHKASIVVCLYGRPEYLTLQSALFADRPGIEDYELIYVSNSPELAEQLVRDAQIASLAYDIDLTLVLLSGNAGFGAANNVAARQAESDRILIVNPDVFPFDEDWAARHSALVATLPAHQTRLFGAPLYYDDGSLMHGGMYFDGDLVVAVDAAGFRRNLTLRVEHYGKGAPALSQEFLRSRPVPAVTGAFMSVDRSWFEKLGGFSEEFVLGHYEDADLCLKSLMAGTVPWIHDLKLWHLEGKGSVTRQTAHEGASIVNRWLFNHRWAETIQPTMLGKQPRHPLLGAMSPPAATRPLPGAVANGGGAGRFARPDLVPRAPAAGLQEIVFGIA